ncbi:MAG: purine-nucleoside phosphorylase [Spirochaetes bacterium]|nr:purine-nucleoside phosphorylase [Spirochaetota bacterium]
MKDARAAESAEYILRKIGVAPKLALVLGSGLGVLAEEIEDPIIVPYSEIPHFPVSTAPGHAGRLVAGRLAGKFVLAMQGRFHFYEGYDLDQVVLPMRAFAKMGVQNLFLTNAAGGVNESFSPGDFMLIRDHINLTGRNPCVGSNDASEGMRFFDMTTAYDPGLRQAARAAAALMGIPLQEGVYMWFTGPSFETPAEIRAARTLGADAVGMSTVPEAIAAVHRGLKVLGLSCITNMAAGIFAGRITSEEVLEVSEREKPRFSAFVKKTVEAIG